MKIPTKTICYTALMTALVVVSTAFLGINMGTTYTNLGDTMIFLTAGLFGPIPAMIAGGLGSFFADMIVFPMTMWLTLIIKGIEGLICGLLMRAFSMQLKIKRVQTKLNVQSLDLRTTCNPNFYKNNNEYSTCEQVLHTHSKLNLPIDNNEYSTCEQTLHTLSKPKLHKDNKKCSAHGRTAHLQSHLLDYLDNNECLTCEQTLHTPSKPKLKNTAQIVLSFCAMLIAGVWMMFGYFIAECFIYGSLSAALFALSANAIQIALSIACALILLYGFKLFKMSLQLKFSEKHSPKNARN